MLQLYSKESGANSGRMKVAGKGAMKFSMSSLSVGMRPSFVTVSPVDSSKKEILFVYFLDKYSLISFHLTLLQSNAVVQ